MGEKILNLGTVHQCNCCLGGKTLHPLISVIDLSKAQLSPHTDIKFGFYTILINECKCEAHAYGQQYYDYSDGALFCLTPGESIDREKTKSEFPSKGWILAFHPDLISGTTLGMSIDNYSFFSYQPTEALHLSLREKQTLLELLSKIDQELQRYIDCHSKKIVSTYIELLLDYCTRFYERQFITRCEANKKIIEQMNIIMDDYYETGKIKTHEMLSAEYCADILQLSSNYLCDLLRYETGKFFGEYIQFKRFEIAKKWLLDTDKNVNQISKELGFQNPQYFSRLFKKLTGFSPNDFRMPN
ncbi:AraC family transcriptional regulator [uncultured Bacteroides sp.]|uniref:helix-turn-helix domain-containing protein n=1 Tax=uncultured Bacteroides sp. TaxID=162156 RepID=UPI0025D57D47|nr:helix-turn-helix domain-containing protein [uncultured Bacteroides sp.]